MQAVVDEQIDLPELGQQPWQTLAAQTIDIGPTIGRILDDGDTDLPAQVAIERRQMDAP